MLTVSSRKSLACVEVVIEFERDDLIGRHTGLQQIVPEKETKQVDLPQRRIPVMILI